MGDVIPLRPRNRPQPAAFDLDLGLEPPPEDFYEFEPPYDDEEEDR